MLTTGPWQRKLRTQVSLPKPVCEAARTLRGKSTGAAPQLILCFLTAIQSDLRLLKRKQMDANFAGRSEDADDQVAYAPITGTFSQGHWEAFALAQKKL
jgi:hypothetical protein